MARSISFTVRGPVDTDVIVTEGPDGTLRFDLAVADGHRIGDLRGLFFDLDGHVAGDDLRVEAAEGFDGLITGERAAEGRVDRVWGDVNVKGRVAREQGPFDVGLAFGAPGAGRDDVREVSFVLRSTQAPLTLDMLDGADLGLRYASVGREGGRRGEGAKIAADASGVARDDVLDVREGERGSVDLLANDSDVDGARIVAVSDADGAFEETEAGFARAVVVDGRDLGRLLVARDGIASFEAVGEDADALAAGAAAMQAFSYTLE